jgi:hypothetical protein
LAEEARKAEAARVAEEARRLEQESQEQARLAEEARKAAAKSQDHPSPSSAGPTKLGGKPAQDSPRLKPKQIIEKLETPVPTFNKPATNTPVIAPGHVSNLKKIWERK